jgi:hypothetical protein
LRLITWKDRITDTSNLWLNALRTENDQKLEEATVLYLRDSIECLKKGLLTRAALSCSCAADCQEKLERYGESRRLYLETARLYEESARGSFGRSVRESLWLLQESSDYYALIGDKQKASEILDRYLSLARRLDPFAVVDGNDSPRRTVKVQESSSSSSGGDVVVVGGSALPQDPEVREAVEEFFRLRNQEPPKKKSLNTVPPQRKENGRTGNESGYPRRTPNETSIVS